MRDIKKHQDYLNIPKIAAQCVSPPEPTPSPQVPFTRAFTSPCSLTGDIIITNITDFTVNKFDTLDKVFYINSGSNPNGFNGCAYISDLEPNISNYISLGIPVYDDNETHTYESFITYALKDDNMNQCSSDHPSCS